MTTNPYYASRAQAAHAAAEVADDPRDKAAWKAAAKTWEQLAKPLTKMTYSMEPHRQQLAALKRDAAVEILANEPECGFSPEGFNEDVAHAFTRQQLAALKRDVAEAIDAPASTLAVAEVVTAAAHGMARTVIANKSAVIIEF